MTLSVSHGAVVQVDPDELRLLAQRVEAVVPELRSARERWQRAELLKQEIPRDVPIAWTGRTMLASRLDAAIRDADALAVELRLAADVYEIVEGRMRAIMLSRAGETMPDAELLHLTQLGRQNPEALARAERALSTWEAASRLRFIGEWSWTTSPLPSVDLGRVATGLVLGTSLFRASHQMGRGSSGELARQAARAGGGPVSPPAIRASAAARSAAPATLAEAVRRIPNDEENGFGPTDRVRVDRYTMPDGQNRFVASIAGSQGNPLDGSDPWSWQNNIGLYLGEEGSEGYDFTIEALRLAGAEPGDLVDVAGFSQGAMIAQRIATDSDFDVRRVTIVGSPQHAHLGDGVTALTIAHSDDPVAMLADGGSPASLADRDSVLVQRRHHDGSQPLWDPWVVGSHRVDSYAETAAHFEESGDPRVGDFRDHLDELAGAATVETFVFSVPE